MAATRQQLAGEVGAALQRYQRSTAAYDDAVGRTLGLNPADLRCLDWLTDGPMTAGQISEATGLRPAATTALIDRLTHKGFVRRAESPTDRRQVLVEMTDEGRARTWECYGPLVEAGAPLMARLTREQLAMMRDQLVAMREITDRQRAELLPEA